MREAPALKRESGTVNNITRRQVLLACLAVGVLGAWVAWTYHRAADSPVLKQMTEPGDQIRETEAVRKAGWITSSVRLNAQIHQLTHDDHLPEDETVLSWVREKTSDEASPDSKAPPLPPATMRPDGGIEFAYGTLYLKTAWIGSPKRKSPVVIVITILPPGDPTGANCVVMGLGREENVGGAAFEGRSWSEVRAEVVDFERGWPAPLDVVRTARFVPFREVAYPRMGALKQLPEGNSLPSDDPNATKEPR
ncbi:MAG: hypothetical protein K8T90_01115 [Planctomycetes bacterium]|nr:hypothetical protein [Planctomycetota bacterium]